MGKGGRALVVLLAGACDDGGRALPAPDRIQWARSIGGPGEDVTQSLGLGPIEQGILALRSDGELEVGGRRFPAAPLPRTVLVRFDRDGGLTPLTTLSPGEQAGPVDLFELSVATDALQNMALAGTLAGDDFALEDGTVLPRQDANGFEPFVALLDPSGRALWARRGERARVQRLVAGPEGFWVAGRAQGEVTFGEVRTSTEDGDGFVARFGPAGALERFVRFSAPGLILRALDVGPNAVWVAGQTEGGALEIDGLERFEGAGAFLARLDPGRATVLGVRTAILSPATVTLQGVRASGDGAFLFGRYTGDPEGLPQGRDDVWVGRTDAGGALVALGSLQVRGQVSLSGGAADAAGGLWVSGSFRDQLRFGETVLDSGGGLVGFLGRFDASGRPDWIDTLGAGPGVRAAAQLGATPSGDVVLAGVYEGEVSLLDRSLVAAGQTDVLLVRYRSR